MSKHPHFGYTKSGRAVHQRTLDHLPRGRAIDRFNSRLAIIITKVVGSMWCAYAFALFDLISLPDAIRAGTPAIISWIAQTFLQLVLLSVIMVGQNIQAQASDARAAKTFEDTEVIVDRLDLETEGGLKAILDAITAMHATPKSAQLPMRPAESPGRLRFGEESK
jgi:hypothetical protein